MQSPHEYFRHVLLLTQCYLHTCVLTCEHGHSILNREKRNGTYKRDIKALYVISTALSLFCPILYKDPVTKPRLYIIHFFVLNLSPHLSTCEWKCPWLSPAVRLDQSHLSPQPACCRGTDRWIHRGDESLGDQIWTGEFRFKRQDDGRTSASFILPMSIRHNCGLLHFC